MCFVTDASWCFSSAQNMLSLSQMYHLFTWLFCYQMASSTANESTANGCHFFFTASAHMQIHTSIDVLWDLPKHPLVYILQAF